MVLGVTCRASAVACVFMLMGASAPADEPKTPTRTISVVSTGSVLVAPDEMGLTFGIEMVNEKLDVARQEVTAAVQRALAVAKDLGVDAKDMQTERYQMYPEYETLKDSGARGKLLGYLVRSRISLTLRDVSKADALLTSLLGAGIADIKAVEFRTSKLRQHRYEACASAMQAARDTASALASELGLRVGKAITVTEEAAAGDAPGDRRSAPARPSEVDRSSGGPAGGASCIALGQIAVTASFLVVFALE